LLIHQRRASFSCVFRRGSAVKRCIRYTLYYSLKNSPFFENIKRLKPRRRANPKKAFHLQALRRNKEEQERRVFAGMPPVAARQTPLAVLKTIRYRHIAMFSLRRMTQYQHRNMPGLRQMILYRHRNRFGLH
jgi:hypothetical protein